MEYCEQILVTSTLIFAHSIVSFTTPTERTALAITLIGIVATIQTTAYPYNRCQFVRYAPGCRSTVAQIVCKFTGLVFMALITLAHCIGECAEKCSDVASAGWNVCK